MMGNNHINSTRKNREYINAKGGFVYDGDTFQAITDDGNKMTVRIYGADAPEKTQFGASFATDLLAKLVKGERIQLCHLENDKYGRAVCVVHRHKDDVDVSYKMIKSGMARNTLRGGLNSKEYSRGEDLARAGSIGLWKAGKKFSDPSAFRNAGGNKFSSFSEADNYDRSEGKRLESLYRNNREVNRDNKSLGAAVGKKPVKVKSFDEKVGKFFSSLKDRIGGLSTKVSDSEKEFNKLREDIKKRINMKI